MTSRSTNRMARCPLQSWRATTATTRIIGGPGPDAIFGGDDNDVVLGGRRNDTAELGAGDDRSCGTRATTTTRSTVRTAWTHSCSTARNGGDGVVIVVAEDRQHAGDRINGDRIMAIIYPFEDLPQGTRVGFVSAADCVAGRRELSLTAVSWSHQCIVRGGGEKRTRVLDLDGVRLLVDKQRSAATKPTRGDRPPTVHRRLRRWSRVTTGLVHVEQDEVRTHRVVRQCFWSRVWSRSSIPEPSRVDKDVLLAIKACSPQDCGLGYEEPKGSRWPARLKFS
jgi:hypothetical protein